MKSMPHAYAPYYSGFSYVGRHRYSLTFVTCDRIRAFTDGAAVALTLAQVVRAANENAFELVVYCFMPDHLHLVAEGMGDKSDLKAFATRAKQYSGYYFSQANGRAKLWQKGVNDSIIRDDVDLLDRVRYVVNNPVAAGLVPQAADYPFLGSQRWSLEDLIAWCRPRIGGKSSPDAER